MLWLFLSGFFFGVAVTRFLFFRKMEKPAIPPRPDVSPTPQYPEGKGK